MTVSINIKPPRANCLFSFSLRPHFHTGIPDHFIIPCCRCSNKFSLFFKSVITLAAVGKQVQGGGSGEQLNEKQQLGPLTAGPSLCCLLHTSSHVQEFVSAPQSHYLMSLQLMRLNRVGVCWFPPRGSNPQRCVL